MATTVTPQTVDETKLEVFMEKLIGDLGATMATLLACLAAASRGGRRMLGPQRKSANGTR